ncbi:DUF3224 domain-containing protein [Streptomyces sp. Wb2n-11]|uniref:DUF3224 domain-containing protein n=1 Tax=Streptomyces sp. Wb2n-11 TaxID=1030533 RepID=UPI000A58BBC7|nr:DUF3224 domain-containing protein [Streptomyces sp. Wb2n-11]
MTTVAKGTLDVTDWAEEVTAEAEGQCKQANAHCRADFTGDLEGSGRADWLLVYTGGGQTRFVGTHRFEGKLAGRAGSFVLQTHGTYEESGVEVFWEVVAGSGSAGLAGLSGKGGYKNADYTLEYSFA